MIKSQKSLMNILNQKKLTKLYMKKFDACVQKPTETVSEYIANLRDIAQHCDFGTTLNNQLCKQIFCGVHSRVLRDKLWGEDLTLEQIIAKCHLYEQKQESKEIIDHTDNQARSTSDVHAVRGRNFKPHSSTKFQQSKPPNKPQNSKQYSDGRTTQSKRRSCFSCGGIHPPRQCPAYGKVCRRCHKSNHFAKVCRTKMSTKTARVYDCGYEEDQYEEESEEQYVEEGNFVWCNTANDKLKPNWSQELQV